MKNGKPRKWTEQQLREAAKSSFSIANVIRTLGLIPAGGNYTQMKKYLKQYGIDTSHFTGMLWSKGKKGKRKKILSLEEILISESYYTSHRLKLRLIEVGLKKPKCEICGWAKVSEDGRLPLELDHINGSHTDNRLENLRVLCPNCHSLQLNHRGKNKNKKQT